MSDKKPIRSSGTLDIEKRHGPIEVCDHITLPTAYPESGDFCEYIIPLKIECDVCDETYNYAIRVN